MKAKVPYIYIFFITSSVCVLEYLSFFFSICVPVLHYIVLVLRKCSCF